MSELISGHLSLLVHNLLDKPNYLKFEITFYVKTASQKNVTTLEQALLLQASTIFKSTLVLKMNAGFLLMQPPINSDEP